MAYEKNNAKSPRPIPKKIAVNGGTEGSVPTPQNLGVPTPPLPFNANAAAPAGTGGGGDPQAFDPTSMMAGIGAPPGTVRTPFDQSPDPQIVSQVLGMIFHWPADDLEKLKLFVDHLIAQDGKSPAAPDEQQ